MKKFIALFLTLSFMLVLAACGPKTSELLDEAKEDLNVVYSSGDSADSITKKVTLITSGKNSAIITWESSNTDVIANDGTVTRPSYGSGDAEVTLTATIMLDDEEDTKEFDLTVKEVEQTDQEKVDAAKSSLDITYATGDDASSVTSDLTLPTEDGDVTISWISANTDVITNAGVVSRPAYDEDDETVVLTATLTAGDEIATKSFTLTVPALPMTDTDAAEETKSKIIILSNETEATSSFALPTAGANDTVISWTSSNTDVIEITTEAMGAGIKAKVSRPEFNEGDATVTLTATITKNNASVTKTWDIEVPDLETELITIDAARAKSVNDEVRVQGVVTAKIGNNIFVQDDSAGMYVYVGGSAQDAFVVGNKVEIIGLRAVYKDLVQISDVSTVKLIEEDVTLPTPQSFTTISDLIAADIQGQLVKLENFLVVEVPTSVDSGGSFVITDGISDIEVRVDKYLDPKVPANAMAVGDVVDVVAPLGEYFDPQLMIVSTDDVTTVTVDDTNRFELAKKLLYIVDADSVIEDITLPATILGVPVTWSSSNEAYVTADGTVIRPLSGAGDQTVTLTATFDGDTNETKEFSVTIKEDKVYTVTEALSEDDGELVTVNGIVTGINDGDGYFIQDTDGTAIFVKGNHDVMVGDEIEVVGTLDTYTSYGNNLRQLNNSTLNQIVSYYNTIYVQEDLTTQEIVNNHPDYSSQLITLTDVEVETVSNNYGYMFLVTNGDMLITLKASDFGIDTDNMSVGDIISTISFNVYDINYSNLRVVNVTLDNVIQPVEPTDAEKVAALKSELTLSDVVTGDLELITENRDVTISWESDKPGFIAVDGTVTRPAVDANDEIVTLTATITAGNEEDTKVFEITVKAETPPGVATDLFISEYGEPDGGSGKYIEIYNGTGSTIDLTSYSVNKSSNGDGWGTAFELPGTLADGETIIVGSSALTGTTDAALEAGFPISSVTFVEWSSANFNGNDAVGLFKDGTLIDVLGDPSVGDYYSQNEVITRDSSISIGNTTWTPSEWTTNDHRYYDSVGSHTID